MENCWITQNFAAIKCINLFGVHFTCKVMPKRIQLFQVSRNGALKVLDYALIGPEGKDCCNKFVEILGLRTIFPLVNIYLVFVPTALSYWFSKWLAYRFWTWNLYFISFTRLGSFATFDPSLCHSWWKLPHWTQNIFEIGNYYQRKAAGIATMFKRGSLWFRI